MHDYRRPMSYDSLGRRSMLSVAAPSARQLRFICLDLPSVPFRDEYSPQEEMIPCDIPFVDLKGDMITVSAALSRVLHRMGCYALAGGNCCPFPRDVDSRLSVAFHFSDSGFAIRQVDTLEDGKLITLNLLAFRVAQQLKTCMDLARQAGRPMRYNGREVQIDKLVMKSLRRVSKDAWQPEFCIWC
ncbi:hypothetical protein L227DRAFT_580643 [Lentinus tigrinus ALCF2SS1-6]|uniref:Uncharacterized protein n=2 Tax=Lentinus tigrinus TaxID=5365 RepID=A0A5C2RRS1_9APHY|nr:hypothetical protein L227DRAFT_580643 [Lentinus tigrinus ALCF2SS1-6]